MTGKEVLHGSRILGNVLAGFLFRELENDVKQQKVLAAMLISFNTGLI